MTKLMMNELTVFSEPQLEFACGERLEHPRDGLTLFGPVDSSGFEKPSHVCYATFGPKDGLLSLNEFIRTLNGPVNTEEDLDDVLWPHFPGFEEAFHATLPVTPAWSQEIDRTEIEKAVQNQDAHGRVFSVVSLYLDAMTAAKKKDDPFQLFLCVVPDIVFSLCRPKSRVKGGYGHRVIARERAWRLVMDDFFESFEPQQYAYSVDFRRQIKARVMELGVPIQIIRESTLALVRPEKTFGQRMVTPLSDRAWNLGTAFYYKMGRRPWKLSGVREHVCYVGISFKNTEDAGQSACSAAQMFLDDGDGVVFMGDEGRWYSEKRGEYHLDANSAERLLGGVLDTYNQLHGKKLDEVFLHCRSTINEEEFEGYKAACPTGVKLVAVRVSEERLGLRLYRCGTRPVLRGSFWRISAKRGFLWGSGFKPRLRTYDGWDVPQPLCIDIQHGDADLDQVGRDIFGLTKLNYNCCKLGEYQPVTIHFSSEVGEILVSNREIGKILPQFKYYI